MGVDNPSAGEYQQTEVGHCPVANDRGKVPSDLADGPSGIVEGTLVRTISGAVPVENLTAEYCVMVDGGEYRSVVGVARLKNPPTCTVVIPGGLLGADRETHVGSGQLLLIDHWLAAALFGSRKVLVRAAHLVGEGSAFIEEMCDKWLFVVTLEQAAPIQLNGALFAESGQLADTVPESVCTESNTEIAMSVSTAADRLHIEALPSYRVLSETEACTARTIQKLMIRKRRGE